MNEVLPAALTAALAVAISPAPVVAVLAMLGSRRSLPNAVAFGCGWVGAIAVVGALMLVLAEGAAWGSDGLFGGRLRAFFGVVFLIGGVVVWLRRNAVGDRRRAGLERLLSRLDEVRPPVALAVGVGIVLLNPKDLPLTLAGTAKIAAAELATVEALIALALFTLVASVSVTLPVLVYAATPTRSASAIGSARVWLTENERAVTALVLIGVGLLWVGEWLLHQLG